MKATFLRALLTGGSSGDGSDYDRSRMLGLLSQAGCVFCREEKKTLKWFFFWYLHEGYSEPENLERMQRSRGFCPRHTKRLLADGLPQTIASVYLPLVSSAIEELRTSEKNDPSARPAARLAPEKRCPACANGERNLQHTLRSLRTALGDPKVRKAVGTTLAVCVPHLLEVASRLEWAELNLLVDETIRHLQKEEGGNGPGDEGSPAAVIRGLDSDGGYRTGKPVPEANDLRAWPDTGGGAWSPTVARLRQRLSEPGCPICRAQRHALAGYFEWLSTEILEAPVYQWNAAFWLCREHAHEFAIRGDKNAVRALEQAIREHWLVELGRLADDLRRKPDDRLLLRLAGIPRRLRENSHGGARRRRSPRSGLWTALGEALRPPRRILTELRRRSLRTNSCPACVYLETTAARNGDLLARAMADPGTVRVYNEADGLCFRHLPQVLAFCEDPERASVLLRAQRVTMEMLQWELREYQRKQSWTLRYEPKGTEQDAWWRTVAQYTGA